MQGLLGEGLLKFPSQDGMQMGKEQACEATATEQVPVISAAMVKAELFDEVFEKGLPDMEKVEKEAENRIESPDLETLLKDLLLEEPAVIRGAEKNGW